ncbi:Gfo/Idh/MocA family protein [Aurantiacibacter spongiae]|uniref:Gfo/Idh/MocA family oxidoreductase n=1 Tax=Aurantiacibacter spongiae TaxID=2488860 RepID=A0A3N5DK99_9SPHN|nr:Gfo/Idh/MocA family oxidoreductase [Aurantiacibacter spongiae]RPF71185.1 gfo/Idh/MocA family oxidoreductase [Aurantiacibacter spongiae]
MRWGIAGYGWVARDYMAPAIAAAGGTVAAVCDPSREARALAEERGAQGFARLEDMLDGCALDALYVATPNHLHAGTIETAAAAGLPILCEKPLAEDIAGVERIAAVADSGSTAIATAFDQRHHPAHEAVRQRIRAGDLGTVTAIRIVYCCWVDPEWSRGTGENWRAQPRCAGGGAVLDLAPHGLDLAEYLLGEPVGDLSVTLQRRIHDYPVEDGGMVIGRTASHVLFSSHVSYNWPEELPRRRLEIAGTGGLIVATDTMGQDAGGHVSLIDAAGGGRQVIAFDSATTPFVRQALAFAHWCERPSGTFSIARDIAAARRFFAAYRKAQPCP